MKPITLSHQYDPDLKLALTLPAGAACEEAYAEWCNARARGATYQSDYDLVRACAIEPKENELAELIRMWSGVVVMGADAMVNAAQPGDPKLLDPRQVTANYAKFAAVVGMPQLATIEQWIRQYPRKGPPGQAQFGLAQFDFGVVPYRAPEPTEWFAVEQDRKALRNYQVLRSFVASCVLEGAAEMLEMAKTKPGIITTLGAIIRNAAGEEFAKRMGE